MATLEIINNLSLESQGAPITAKQGSIADDMDTPFEITVTGTNHSNTGVLGTGAVRTIWDEDDDSPGDYDYFWLWTDQDGYVQLITGATNVILPVEAKVPTTIWGDQLLAAANTTALTTTEPTLADIDSIVLGNWSGNDMNYVLRIID